MHARAPSSPLGDDPYTQLSPLRRPRRRADYSFSGDSYDGGELDLSSTSTLPSRDDSDAVSRHTWPRRSGDSLDELDFDALPVGGGPVYGGPSVLAPALGGSAPVSPHSIATVRSAQQQPNYEGTPINSIESGREPVVPAMWRGSGAFAHAPPMRPSGSYQSHRSTLPPGARVDRGVDPFGPDRASATGPASHVLPASRDDDRARYRSDLLAGPLEPRFRDPRSNLCAIAVRRSSDQRSGMLRYSGFVPRLIYLLLPLRAAVFVFGHLFLDFNGKSASSHRRADRAALYILSSIACFPNGNTTGRGGSDWIAVGGYALALAIWLFGVVIAYELVYVRPTLVRIMLTRQSYRRVWGREHRPAIVPLYVSAASFNMAAMRDYNYFGFLQHVRLAAWRGPTRLDGALEQLHWLVQNWPTAITLIPRMALCISLLLSYADGDGTGPATQRDPAFFVTADQLTSYACIVLLVNACWAAYRIALVIVAGVLLALLTCSGGASRALGVGGSGKRRSPWYGSDDVLSPTFSGRSTQPEETRKNWAWQWRTEQRIRAAAEFCAAPVDPSLLGEPVRGADAGLAVAQEPEMTQQYRGLPSPFIYQPTTGDGSSQPLSDRDERALLDDTALNAYRNSAGSSQPHYPSADQQSIRRVPPPSVVPVLRPAPDAEDADSGDEASSESDTVEQHHVVPGSPDPSAAPLPGRHQTLGVRVPPPVSPTPASSALPDGVSATVSRVDSVRQSGMHPAPVSPSLSPEQIAILRRNLHDKQDLSDDESDDYARSDPSGLQVRSPCALKQR